jgi:hypothetical protein
MDFSKSLILLFFLVFSSLAYSKDCDEIKQLFLSETQTQSDIDEFKSSVNNDNQCLKNLMGILYYQGKFFPKDQDRAEQIFLDLSNKGYPESQYNYAWLQTKKNIENPEAILGLILGINTRYIIDKKNGHLASKSRDLGREYIDKLEQDSNYCSITTCDSKEKIYKPDEVARFKSNFEDVIQNITISGFENIQAQTAKRKENENEIVVILGLGLAAYKLRAAGGFRGAGGNSGVPYDITTNPNYNWHAPQFCCNPYLFSSPVY